ncbi:hypothetical protein D3C71_1341230 [compost metagenome]
MGREGSRRADASLMKDSDYGIVIDRADLSWNHNESVVSQGAYVNGGVGFRHRVIGRKNNDEILLAERVNNNIVILDGSTGEADLDTACRERLKLHWSAHFMHDYFDLRIAGFEGLQQRDEIIERGTGNSNNELALLPKISFASLLAGILYLTQHLIGIFKKHNSCLG